MRKAVGALLASLVVAGGSALMLDARAADTSFAQIEAGHRLVDAGDCASCHTDSEGKPFAGGRAIPTPFGTIYAPNITPDRETGLGGWSEHDFYRAMHNGVGPDGDHLYPAFPYPFFTKLTRDDVKAIWAYLKTLPPVHKQNRPNDLNFPLNYRVVMRPWDFFFFKPGTFQPNPKKSAEWNRGAYLVQGAGHCGACHTPTNFAGANESGSELLGGSFQNWFAPKIAGNMHNGTGSWSVEDIVEYLKTGRNKHSGAAGPMAEVITNSTSKLPKADLHAIAVYIKDIDGGTTAKASKPDENVMTAGKAIFADSCAACHHADGKGVPQMFPPLAHNANVQQDNPTTVIRNILDGVQTVATDAKPTPFTMPAYDWKLSDQQVAAVASYVRNAWGNSASAVSADQVKALRRKLHEARTNGKGS